MSDGMDRQPPPRVTKVQYYKERVTVERVHMNMGTEELLLLPKCADVPSADFKSAFAALLPLALGIVGIPESAWADAVVSGVSIGRDGKNRRNFVLTLVRPCGHGVCTTNTPVRLERFEDENGPQFADDKLTKLIDRIAGLAVVYAEGAREQLKLGLDEPAPAETPEAGGGAEA